MSAARSARSSDPLAWARGATRRFGSFVAVDDVDLQLGAGEVVGLLGANGAGKTTLIRMLLGLLRPSAGEVALFGEPPSRRTRRRLGYVPQSLGLYDDLTPAENLEFARAAFGDGASRARSSTSARADGARANEAEEETADEATADETAVDDEVVGRLSLGQQRRVAFGEALDHDPDLLVLDEPTSGVAPLERARLWETVHTAADEGVGVLVTTHYMEEAAECDRLVIMAAGQVVAAGMVDDIVGNAMAMRVESEAWAEAFAAIEAAGLRATLVGRSLRLPGADRADVERALADHDVQAEISEVPATLEERFFELTVAAPPG